MNDVLTPILARLRPRRRRCARRGRGRARRDPRRPGHRRAGRRLHRRAARQGRDRRPSSPRSCARCTRYADARRRGRRRDRHVRHRRRPRRHGQRLDDGRADRGGRRCAGREARQPRRVVAVRLGRRARGARRRDRARARAASRACVEEAGIGFCFAPRFHPAMRFLGPARRELGVPTTFNFLGPLANPARVRRQAIGVSDATMAHDDARRAARARRRARAGVLRRRRPRRAHDHHDEHGARARRRRDPRATRSIPLDFGIARATASDLRGGDAATNAAVRPRRCSPARTGRTATSRC